MTVPLKTLMEEDSRAVSGSGKEAGMSLEHGEDSEEGEWGCVFLTKVNTRRALSVFPTTQWTYSS